MYSSSRDNRGRPRKHFADPTLEASIVRELASEGKSFRAIAIELQCSPTTVRNHYSDAYREGQQDYIIACVVERRKNLPRIELRQPLASDNTWIELFAGLVPRAARAISTLEDPGLDLDRALLLVLNFIVIESRLKATTQSGDLRMLKTRDRVQQIMVDLGGFPALKLPETHRSWTMIYELLWTVARIDNNLRPSLRRKGRMNDLAFRRAVQWISIEIARAMTNEELRRKVLAATRDLVIGRERVEGFDTPLT